MRLAVAGGKTGGHIYPAVSVIEALERENGQSEVLWLGRAGGPEEEVARARGWSFAAVRAAEVRGMGLRAPIGAAAGLLGAVGAARRLRAFGAETVLATGGFVSVPGVLGARLAGVPVLVLLPDVRPGWAVRFLRHFASLVAVTCEGACRYLGRTRTVQSGYPVRQDFYACTRAEARSRLGLDERPAVLVMGGSTGSESLNRAAVRWAPSLVPAAQVIHVSGRKDHSWVSEQARELGLDAAVGYHLHAYLEELPEAMIAADLVISRAGASVLGEIPAAGKPVILVPGSFSDQWENARYLEGKGCAVVIDNEDVEEKLGAAVLGLLGDPDLRSEMAARAGALSRPGAARELACLLIGLARRS